MSSRGLPGAAKPRSHQPLTGSAYGSGRSAVGGRAAGPLLGKHALQTLGKPAAVVRRMPPPANLPSLKAEHGQDIIGTGLGGAGGSQTGQQGWNKSIDGAGGSKNQSADNGTLSSGGGPDLRPTWAKSAAAVVAGHTSAASDASGGPAAAAASAGQAQRQTKPAVGIASAAINREFPTLAASLAASNNKQSSTTSTTTGTHAANNASDAQKNQRGPNADRSASVDQAPIIPVPPPPASNTSYIGATVRTDANRKLPERYCGVQDTRPSMQRRYDVRQKLAQLSLESKESASPSAVTAAAEKNPMTAAVAAPTDSSASVESAQQQQGAVDSEQIASQANSTPSATQQQPQQLALQQQNPASSGGAPVPLASVVPQQPPMQQQQQPTHAGTRASQEQQQHHRSQDVRQQYYPQHSASSQAPPQMDEPPIDTWGGAAAAYENDYAPAAGAGPYDYHAAPSRGEIPGGGVPSAPTPQPQPLLGRADTGPPASYGRGGIGGPPQSVMGAQQMRGPPPSQQRMGAVPPQAASRSRYEYVDEGVPQQQQHHHGMAAPPQPLMASSHRYAAPTGWGDAPPASGGGPSPPHPHGWNMPPQGDEHMAGYARQSHSRPRPAGGYRGPESDTSGWYSAGPPHQQPPAPMQRRGDPNSWGYAPPSDYDASGGYPHHPPHHPSRAASNRSRTTSNSYGDDYDAAGMYQAPYDGSERRYKRRGEMPEEAVARYDYDYADGGGAGYERQKYHDYEMHHHPPPPPQQQQPAYRMLKRNDEKSAEYFSSATNHNAPPVTATELAEPLDEDSMALSQLTRLGRSAKAMHFASMNSDSVDVGSSAEGGFESSMEQRKTPQQHQQMNAASVQQQKFNRAPGSGKPQQVPNESTHAEPPRSAENVWKKRMEEQQLRQQEEKMTWQNAKQHKKFDNNFPPMAGDKKTEGGMPPPHAGGSRPKHASSSSSSRHSASVNQRAPTSWDDLPASWGANSDYSSASVAPNSNMNEGDDADDDVYEGTRREFYNRQRGGGARTQTRGGDARKPHDGGGDATSRRQHQAPPPSSRTGGASAAGAPRKRNPNNEPVREPAGTLCGNIQAGNGRGRGGDEDTFSNMGEFHAEDYKIEDVRAPPAPPPINRFDDEGGFEADSKSQQKDEHSRSASNRQGGGGPRKTLHSDERHRQLKPQRAPGTRTWQRHHKSITEEQAADENEDTSEAQKPRSYNQRQQRGGGGQNSSQQPRSQNAQQQSGRRNNNTNGNPNNRNLAATSQSTSGNADQQTKAMVKSPARSENGLDEWETASESSDPHGRKSKASRKPPQNRPQKTREKNPRETNGTGKSSTPPTEGQHSQQRSNAGQKNVKPASHTFHQNNDAFVKSSSNNEPSTNQQQPPSSNQLQTKRAAAQTNGAKRNARDTHRSATSADSNNITTVNNRDGLAGLVDLHDASVVVIDEDNIDGRTSAPRKMNGLIPTDTTTGKFDGEEEDDDFEEVVSRKTKRQRQLQQQLEEERAARERQKAEQRRQQQQQQKDNKKPGAKTKKTSAASDAIAAADRARPEEPSLAFGDGNHQEQKQRVDTEGGDAPPKPALSSSLSPLSAATDPGGLVGLSSPSSQAVAAPIADEQPTARMNINVHQSAVWNSPSPQVAPNAVASQPTDEPEYQSVVMPSPIARPKQRVVVDNGGGTEAKTKLATADAPVELAFAAKKSTTTASENPTASSYPFSSATAAYERTIADDHADLQEKLNMAKIKDFWPGESDDYIGNGFFGKQPMGGSDKNSAAIVTTQEQQTTKARPADAADKMGGPNSASSERDLHSLREEVNRSKSQSSSVQRPFSNSPLGASGAFFGGHGNVIYPTSNSAAHYNPMTPYSLLLADNTNGRDFMNGPTPAGAPFGAMHHTSSPPIPAATSHNNNQQSFVDARSSLASFTSPATKIYMPTSGVTATSNDWAAQAPNAAVTNANKQQQIIHAPINSPSPLQLQNAFGGITNATIQHPAAGGHHHFQAPPNFQSAHAGGGNMQPAPTMPAPNIHHAAGPPPPPINHHNVPPPPINNKFAPNYPPPNFIPTPPRDFRFPPPNTHAAASPNYNGGGNGRGVPTTAPIPPNTFPHALNAAAAAPLNAAMMNHNNGAAMVPQQQQPPRPVQRRPSQGGAVAQNVRQNSSPLSAAGGPPPHHPMLVHHLWNGGGPATAKFAANQAAPQQHSFGLF